MDSLDMSNDMEVPLPRQRLWKTKAVFTIRDPLPALSSHHRNTTVDPSAKTDSAMDIESKSNEEARTSKAATMSPSLVDPDFVASVLAEMDTADSSLMNDDDADDDEEGEHRDDEGAIHKDPRSMRTSGDVFEIEDFYCATPWERLVDKVQRVFEEWFTVHPLTYIASGVDPCSLPTQLLPFYQCREIEVKRGRFSLEYSVEFYNFQSTRHGRLIPATKTTDAVSTPAPIPKHSLSIRGDCWEMCDVSRPCHWTIPVDVLVITDGSHTGPPTTAAARRKNAGSGDSTGLAAEHDPKQASSSIPLAVASTQWHELCVFFGIRRFLLFSRNDDPLSEAAIAAAAAVSADSSKSGGRRRRLAAAASALSGGSSSMSRSQGIELDSISNSLLSTVQVAMMDTLWNSDECVSAFIPFGDREECNYRGICFDPKTSIKTHFATKQQRHIPLRLEHLNGICRVFRTHLSMVNSVRVFECLKRMMMDDENEDGRGKAIDGSLSPSQKRSDDGGGLGILSSSLSATPFKSKAPSAASASAAARVSFGKRIGQRQLRGDLDIYCSVSLLYRSNAGSDIWSHFDDGSGLSSIGSVTRGVSSNDEGEWRDFDTDWVVSCNLAWGPMRGSPLDCLTLDCHWPFFKEDSVLDNPVTSELRPELAPEWHVSALWSPMTEEENIFSGTAREVLEKTPLTLQLRQLIVLTLRVSHRAPALFEGAKAGSDHLSWADIAGRLKETAPVASSSLTPSFESRRKDSGGLGRAPTTLIPSDETMVMMTDEGMVDGWVPPYSPADSTHPLFADMRHWFDGDNDSSLLGGGAGFKSSSSLMDGLASADPAYFSVGSHSEPAVGGSSSSSSSDSMMEDGDDAEEGEEVAHSSREDVSGVSSSFSNGETPGFKRPKDYLRCPVNQPRCAPLYSPISLFVLRLLQERHLTLSYVAETWRDFLAEVMQCWETKTLIPGIAEGPPDLSACLLFQKLQMLNECMVRNENHERSMLSLLDMASSMSPPSSAAMSAGHSRKHTDSFDGDWVWSSKRADSLFVTESRMDGKSLIADTSQPLRVPVTQEHEMFTSDMLEDHYSGLLSLGSSKDATKKRAELQSEQLRSDMSAFKASNGPLSKLGDFIRWYSPNDWSESESKLSARMSVEGNLWERLWDECVAMPAHLQDPLFDCDKAGAECIAWLMSLQPRDTLLQMCQIGVGCVFAILRRTPGSVMGVPSITERLSHLKKSLKRLWRPMPSSVEGIRTFELDLTALEQHWCYEAADTEMWCACAAALSHQMSLTDDSCASLIHGLITEPFSYCCRTLAERQAVTRMLGTKKRRSKSDLSSKSRVKKHPMSSESDNQFYGSLPKQSVEMSRARMKNEQRSSMMVELEEEEYVLLKEEKKQFTLVTKDRPNRLFVETSKRGLRMALALSEVVF